jgi:hypothetical protein
MDKGPVFVLGRFFAEISLPVFESLVAVVFCVVAVEFGLSCLSEAEQADSAKTNAKTKNVTIALFVTVSIILTNLTT